MTAVGTVLAAASFLAEAGGATIAVNPGLIAQVLQFGFLGAVFVDVVSTHKFLVPAWTTKNTADGHDKELQLKDDQITALKADIIELKAANQDLQKLTSEKMIPALVQATEVSRAYVSELARRAGGDGHAQT